VGENPSAPLECWGELFFHLRESGFRSLAEWLTDAVQYTETALSRAAETGEPDAELEAAGRRDLSALSALAALEPISLRALLCSGPLSECPANALDLPLWPTGTLPTYEELLSGYRSHGAGVFARSRAFLWDSGVLHSIASPDIPAPEALIGYRLQRAQVEKNTYALLSGKRVNNVLLYGESGTGKSAAVKSLLSLPGTEELRLIEIEKSGVATMPQLMRQLAGRRQKFILFLDDLAFDQDDMTYSVLKTILEGGLEPRSDNTAIYATSNRRHLVRQTFSDRAGDEVDCGETIQEKTALADRFGLRIPYQGLNQAEFLALIDVFAVKEGLTLPTAELHARAMRWDVRHPGRTPRSAQQFLTSQIQM